MNAQGATAVVGVFDRRGPDPNAVLDRILLSAPDTAGEEAHAGEASEGGAVRHLRGGPGPRRSFEVHQMSGSVDSTLRLLDLADEGRFPLMSHVWRLDKRDES
jgi:hypothetical protein